MATSLNSLAPPQSSQSTLAQRQVSVKEEIARRNAQFQNKSQGQHAELKSEGIIRVRNLAAGLTSAAAGAGVSNENGGGGGVNIQRALTAVPVVGGSSEGLADRDLDDAHRMITTSLKYQKDYETALREAIVTLNSERRVEAKRRKDQDSKWEKLRATSSSSSHNLTSSQNISSTRGSSIADLSALPTDEEIERIMADRAKVDVQYGQRRRKVLMGIRNNFEMKIAYSVQTRRSLEGTLGKSGDREWVELSLAIKKTNDLLQEALPDNVPAPISDKPPTESPYDSDEDSIPSSADISPEASPVPSPSLGRRCVTQENLPTPLQLPRAAVPGRMSAEGLLERQGDRGHRKTQSDGVVGGIIGERRGSEERETVGRKEGREDGREEKETEVGEGKLEPGEIDSLATTAESEAEGSMEPLTGAETLSTKEPVGLNEGYQESLGIEGRIEVPVDVPPASDSASLPVADQVDISPAPSEVTRDWSEDSRIAKEPPEALADSKGSLNKSRPVPHLDFRKSAFISVPSVEELIQLATKEQSKKRQAEAVAPKLSNSLHDSPVITRKSMFRSASTDSLSRVAPWKEPPDTERYGGGIKSLQPKSTSKTKLDDQESHRKLSSQNIKLFSKSKSRLLDTSKTLSKSEASLSMPIRRHPTKKESSIPEIVPKRSQDELVPAQSTSTTPSLHRPARPSIDSTRPTTYHLSTSPSQQSLSKYARPSIAGSSMAIYSATYDDEARLHDLAASELISIMEETRLMKASEILPRVRRSRDSTLKKILSRFGGRGRRVEGLVGSRVDLSEGHVFGRSIEELMVSDDRSSITTMENKPQAPAFVVKCCDAIQKSGMTAAGIFRVAGLRSRVAQMKNQLDAGEEIEFDDKSPHEVANLLKAFLREMPEPLLMGRLFKVFLKTAEITDPDLRLRALRLLVALLPRCHQSTLRYLLGFLNDVAAHSDSNKMTASSLAIVIGPNILRQKAVAGKVTKDALVTYNNTVEVVTVMIERWDELFQLPDSVIDKLHPTPSIPHPPMNSPSTPSAVTASVETPGSHHGPGGKVKIVGALPKFFKRRKSV
ncbi:hypothetical protein HK097_004927 [Rhizophlyctis rosea]|uniref:Rho-GAP domain-containing protein n=1 Tax=Rhizophlyctis rosea TaxID=64517 RepID=A0AAD5X2M8_9FUNG|nr:hypothetical protein HK097_004927 [Rhizophlyctis rosea]